MGDLRNRLQGMRREGKCGNFVNWDLLRERNEIAEIFFVFRRDVLEMKKVSVYSSINADSFRRRNDT